MYFQTRYLKESKAFPATSGLETIDLPNKGLLSGLALRVWGVPGSTTGSPDNWLHDGLEKIEIVVNGSKVIKSLTGDQLLALMLYQKMPHYSHAMKNVAGTSCEEFFFINFGRHYHDLDYMLDLGRVNDPELRISYDFTKTSVNGWTNGEAISAAPSYDLIPHLLRESDIAPKGYVKSSEVYRFTSGASKKENMSLPRGPLYSNLYLQSWYASEGLTGNLDKLALNLNNDAIIPIHLGVTALLDELVKKYGLFRMSQQVYLTGGQAYPYPLEVGYMNGQLHTGCSDVRIALTELWDLAQPAAFRKVATDAPDTSTVDVMMSIIGSLPFAMAAIPYFDPWDDRFWIDSSKLGDFWLSVEEAAGAGTNATIKLLADEIVTTY